MFFSIAVSGVYHKRYAYNPPVLLAVFKGSYGFFSFFVPSKLEEKIKDSINIPDFIITKTKKVSKVKDRTKEHIALLDYNINALESISDLTSTELQIGSDMLIKLDFMGIENLNKKFLFLEKNDLMKKDTVFYLIVREFYNFSKNNTYTPTSLEYSLMSRFVFDSIEDISLDDIVEKTYRKNVEKENKKLPQKKPQSYKPKTENPNKVSKRRPTSNSSSDLSSDSVSKNAIVGKKEESVLSDKELDYNSIITREYQMRMSEKNKEKSKEKDKKSFMKKKKKQKQKS